MNIKEKIQSDYDEILQLNCIDANKQRETVCRTIFDAIDKKYQQFDGYQEAANLALGCGFPFQFIDFNDVNSILDLGCASGVDCFIMHKLIADNAKIIGIDLTESLIQNAQKIAISIDAKNISFVVGDIEKLPFENNSFDAITSNGVFSLIPNIQNVFNEVFRVLKPGGQFCFSDINKKEYLDLDLYEEIKKHTGCLSGIRMQQYYLEKIKKSGFQEIEIIEERNLVFPDDVMKTAKINSVFISTFKIEKK